MTSAPASATQVPFLYVVGGEEYVFREIRRKLLLQKVNIAGHAKLNWKPPFAVPKHATHIMVVEDDCPGPLRIHAHRLSTELGIPVFEAPARNKWTETEELLKKEGIIESPLPVVPPRPPAPLPVEAPVAEATASPAPPPVATPAPAPEPASPVVTIGEALLEKERQRQEGAPVKPNMTSPKALALRIMKESDGLAGDRPIAEAINLALKPSKPITAYQVRVWRGEAKIRPAKRGTQSQHIVELLARYGVKRASGSEVGRRASETKKARGVRPTRRPKPTAEPASGDDFVTALRAALDELKEKVIVPFNVQALSLSFADGKWEAPEVERVELRKVAGKVEL